MDTESHKIRKPVTNVGSLHRSSRRNEFSAADDRLLIAHIKKHPGAAIQGNRIYDILAAEVFYCKMCAEFSTPIILLNHGGIDGLKFSRNDQMFWPTYSLLLELKLTLHSEDRALDLPGNKMGLF